VELLRNGESWSIRRDAARVIGRFGRDDESTILSLWHGLLDRDNDVRTSCAVALAQLGQRFPQSVVTIEQKLLDAIANPLFVRLDNIDDRTGHDYAFSALWMLYSNGLKTSQESVQSSFLEYYQEK
jgi:hypothetical protein